MPEQIILTQAKFDELTTRLKYLETTGRADVALAIKTAKEFGDLSENAEYSAAKDAQVEIEIEIATISETLLFAVVMDESAISTKTVSLGTLVTVHDNKYDEVLEYRIVSSTEANSRDNKLSNLSPIGLALMGHRKGETVTAKTPGGELKLTIINISK